ncbi:lipase 1-like [Teleopsis dalmanni]|uniref:lipase 1-like n=1 Tax=Teleopsis dalmanni TaxID=139649 RepID=UPI0018CD2865|nr:lipase 1-like [Teleopsis dalmanni]
MWSRVLLHNEQFLRFVAVLCCVLCFCTQRTYAVKNASATFSISFNGIDLFNIPAFGRSLFGVTESPNDVNLSPSFSYEISSAEPDPNIMEDARLKTPKLIKKYGYPVEVHHVVTDDGYILELHRIVREGATPVLLTHGLLDSSATWVMMGPNKGLAYMLYDSNYDVWMTNVRGNSYSRNHTKYSTDHAKFWDFSFHEMGKYDLPASIDHILRTTDFERIHYIGHSQGTTIFWVMCSERPEYSEKILLMQGLAPVAFVKHSKSPVVNFLAFFQEPLSLLLRLIGAHEFLPSNDFLTMFSQIICDDDTITKEICSNVIFLITGFDKEQMNETMLPVILGHAPAGAATKQMQHFGQLKRENYFRQYDYGWIRNYWRYDSITPPDYKLMNVRNKVALHYSENDWLAPPEDVDHLSRLLPNLVGKFLVDYPAFNHLDFVWGIDARELLFNRIVQLMRRVEEEIL